MPGSIVPLPLIVVVQPWTVVEFPLAAPESTWNISRPGAPSAGNCNDYYRTAISVPSDGWYECTVAFKDLQQAGWGMYAPFDVGAVMGAQFNFEVWQAPYDLSVDNLRFYASPNVHTGCVRIGR
jgi:hypothetical protein